MCVMTYKVEGCNSIHLVRQILSYLDRLFLAVATSENTPSNTTSSSKNQHPLTSEGNNADLSLPKLYATTATANNSDTTVSDTGDAVSAVYLPHITFKWVKATIHCLLRSPAPNIRRVIFERLLSSKLILQPTLETCEWLIYELFLNLTDNVSFFSTYYLDGSVNLGCQRAITEVFEYYKGHNYDSFMGHNSDPSVSTGGKVEPLYIGGSYVSGIVFDDTSSIYEKKRHPGIPLPSFLARTIAVLHLTDKRENSRLVEYFLINLLTVICDSNNGMHSLSAVKWILRPFCEVCVLILLPRCIYTNILDRIKVFLRSRLACSNGFVRGHILTSLLPLIWRCVALQPQRQPTDNNTNMISTNTIPSTHATNDSNNNTSEGSSRGNKHKDILTLLDLSVNYIGLDILLSTFLSATSPVSSNSNNNSSTTSSSNNQQEKEEGSNNKSSHTTSTGLAYILFDTLSAAFTSTHTTTYNNNTNTTIQSIYSLYTPKEVYLLSIATILLTCLSPTTFSPTTTTTPTPTIFITATTATTANHGAQTEPASPILLIFGGDQIVSDARNLLNSAYMSCNKVMSILYYIRGIIHMQYYITKYKYINNTNYTVYTTPYELLLALPDVCTYIVSELNKMLTYSYTYAISDTTGSGNGNGAGLTYPTSNNTTSLLHDIETYDLLIEVLYGSLQLSIHYAHVDENRNKNRVSVNNRLQIIDSILTEINKVQSILMIGYDIHTTPHTTTQHTTTTSYTTPVHILTSLYIHAFNKAFICLLHICDIYYTYIQYLIQHDILKIGFQTLIIGIQNIAIKIGHNSDPLFSAMEFKKYTERINIHNDTPTTANNNSNILLVHYINDSSIKQQYSRAANALVTNRFSALNAICSILQALQIPSIAFLTTKTTTMSTLDTPTFTTRTTTPETSSNPSSAAVAGAKAAVVVAGGGRGRGGGGGGEIAQVGTAATAAAMSLLETLFDQLDSCSPMSVTPILVCCHHCIRALLSTLSSSTTTSTTTDTGTTTTTTTTTIMPSDDLSGGDSSSVLGIHTLVERALSQAYRAALTTSEGADANAINAFINMCFDPTLIEHMDSYLLQVSNVYIYCLIQE